MPEGTARTQETKKRGGQSANHKGGKQKPRGACAQRVAADHEREKQDWAGREAQKTASREERRERQGERRREKIKREHGRAQRHANQTKTKSDGKRKEKETRKHATRRQRN